MCVCGGGGGGGGGGALTATSGAGENTRTDPRSFPRPLPGPISVLLSCHQRIRGVTQQLLQLDPKDSLCDSSMIIDTIVI